ncbi:MAG: hypothetical protein KY456_16500, partial [Chloroflexi bacterium]|nr:hypothetical protein [Chloroflexota bacterium]
MAQVGVVSAVLLAGAMTSGFAGFPGDEQTAHAPAIAVPLAWQGERGAAQVRGRPPVLIPAGDIARCGSRGDEATATLIRDMPGT